MPKRFSYSLFVVPFLVAGMLTKARADVKMPAIFGDHMVLQQDTKLPVWGTAPPGEQVTATFAGQTGTATAAADGKWRIDLPPVPANSQSQVLTVTGKNTLTFQDVLVGDVWIGSGQSNMDRAIDYDDRSADAITKSNDPQLRLFVVPVNATLDAQNDIKNGGPLRGTWKICTSDLLGSQPGKLPFSAVAYYFAREIRHTTGHPVGMIESAVGGTPAQAWTSLSGLQKDSATAHYAEEHQKYVDNFAAANAALPTLTATYQAELAKWNDEGGKAYADAVKEWNVASQQARATGQPLPVQPTAPAQPKPKLPPNIGNTAVDPCTLFNGMIAPLIPFAIKGVIWYQGESNAFPVERGDEYASLFPCLIADWREKWGQGDFPFIYVQLATFGVVSPSRGMGDSGWDRVRDAQLKTLSLPNTGMATAVDIGSANIHPKDKLDVGLRLALVARHVAYGEKDLVYSGPLYDSMTIEGSAIRLKFTNCGGGLTIGVPPWAANGKTPVLASDLNGFGIAGPDGKFVTAKAVIDGNTVVVSSDKVVTPASVRYDWGPTGNLYNKEGLPSPQFRTDSLPSPASKSAPTQPQP